MKTPPAPNGRPRAGYSLFMTLILIAAMMITISATMSRMVSSAKMNDRQVSYMVGQGAAEAAVEKVMARMMVDFANNGEGTIVSNLSYYKGLIPNSSENPFWTNFAFMDGVGNSNKVYIARTTTNANPPYVQLQSQYPGLNGFASTYRIMANVTPLGDAYNFTNALQQDVQMAQIPIFQFAIFYNSLLEFTWAAPFIIQGRVYCNTNIYVGSSSALSFSNVVSSSGVITNPAWGGYTQGQYTGAISYTGSPPPGYDTGAPTLTLPVGTNNSAAAVLQVLYPPVAGEAATSAMGQQRYYNKAGMVISVSNTTVTVTLQNPPFSDASPITFTNWTVSSNNINYFLSTNLIFGEDRENILVRATQIDIGKFNTWMATNALVAAKFNSTAPLNILYVADWRITNGTKMSVVRLMNGATLPTYGLTVATPNPLYIWGNYNCPNAANLSSTNVLGTVPASVICDALTILSSAWSDSLSTNSTSPSSLGSRNAATSTTVDAAIMSGVVYTTGSAGSAFSGGVMNLTRLLEDWGNGGAVTLTLNTSIVNFFGSAWATNQWQTPGTYYYAPTRRFSFNQNYTTASGLPPGTPQICRMIRASWCPPPPGVTNYAPPILDYVPN